MARNIGVVQFATDNKTLNHMSSQLMQVNQIARPSVCAGRPPFDQADPAKTICAISDRPGQATCNGDSGGPVTRMQGTERVLVGLVSWSKGCALPGTPTIFTSLPAFQTWIVGAKAEMIASARRR
jgi:secreted trypsin-like serine protease